MINTKIIYILLLFAAVAYGQSGTTVVTAKVQDSAGSVYVNCQWSVVFVGENSTPGVGPYAPAPLLNGQQGTCDSQGNFSINLADNVLTVTPTPSQWSFSICSAGGYLAGPYCKANILITITGGTQNISSILTPLLPLLPTSGPGGMIVFPGVPTGTCSPPQTALNQSTGDFYSCSGGHWLKVGPISSAGNPGGSVFQLQTNASGVSFGGIANAAKGSWLASQGTSAFAAFQTKWAMDVRDLGVDCTGVVDASSILNSLTGNPPASNNAISGLTLSFGNCPAINLANTWTIYNQASFIIEGLTRGGSAGVSPTFTWTGAASGTMIQMEYVDSFNVHGISLVGGTNGGVGIIVDKNGSGGVWNTTDGRFVDDTFNGAATNWVGLSISPVSGNNVERMQVENSAFYCGAPLSTTAGVGVLIGPSANAKSEVIKDSSFTQCFYGIYQKNGSMYVSNNEFELNGGTCGSGAGSDIRIDTTTDVDVLEKSIGEDDTQFINTNGDSSSSGPGFPVVVRDNHWGTAGCTNTANYFIDTPTGSSWIIEGNGWDPDAGIAKLIGTNNNGSGGTIYTKGNTWPNETFNKWWTNSNVANSDDLKILDDRMMISPVYSGTGPNFSSAFLDFRGYLSVGSSLPDDFVLQNIPAGGLTNQGGTFLIKHQQGATGTEMFGWDGSYPGINITQIPNPAVLSVTQGGTGASTSYTYAVVAYGPLGNTAGSSASNTTTGAATLNTTNFNIIQWYPVAGATKYCIWRTSSSGTPSSTGDIGCTSALQFKANSGIPTFGYTLNAGLFTSAYKFNDTGLAGDSTSLPVTNTTGSLVVTNIPAGTSPICPNGPNGAFTTAGCASGGSGLTGAGTLNHLPVWTSSTNLGNSSLIDNGTTVSTTESISTTASGLAISAPNGAFSGTSLPGSCSIGTSWATEPACYEVVGRIGAPAGATGEVTALFGSSATGTTTLTSTPFIAGVYGSGFLGAAGSPSWLAGVVGTTNTNGLSGTVAVASGVVGIGQVGDLSAGGQTATLLEGVYGQVQVQKSTLTNPFSAAFYADSPVLTGTSSHNYGFYMADQTGGGANNPDPWGIYEAGTAKNSLGGSLQLRGITGSTQCLHVDTTGLVSGTGADCGAGGGGGTVTHTVGALGANFWAVGNSGADIETLDQQTNKYVDLPTSTAPGNPGAGNVRLFATSGGGFSCLTSAGANCVGAVQSVGLTQTGSVFTITGSPVTTTGNLNLAFASETANFAFIAPNGSSGAPTFRALVGADIPAINIATSGAGGVTGILLPVNGGTGVSSPTAHTVPLAEGSAAFVLASPGALGNCFMSNGTSSDPSFQTCPSGFADPMTTLGDMITYNGSSAIRVAGPTTPNIAWVLTSTPAGGVASLPTWSLPGVAGRAVTGTTATDTLVSADCTSRVEYIGSVAVATSLPTPSTLAVPLCVFKLTNNITTVNDITVTPAGGWTVNGAATLAIHNGQNVWFYVDPSVGSNWAADVDESVLIAGSGITFSRTGGVAGGLTITSFGGGSGTVTSIATTSPITGGTITTTGTIACATCVVASSPGAGIAHFAGSTQTVTSSPVNLASDVSGSLPTTALAIGALPNGITATTQAAGDSTADVATDSFVTTAVNNAIAAVNPAVAVLAASTASLTGTYANGASGIGATFTVTATGAFTLDGISIGTIGQRVLLKNQASGFQNGIYTATVVGATGISPVFTRALNYDQPSDMNTTGSIPVQSGTANGSTSWLQTSTVNTVGTDAVTFTQFSLNPVNLVTAVSPGVGLCHFAGSTQTCTSSGVAIADLTATGTPSSTTFLRGDNTWAAASGGSGASGAYTILTKTANYTTVSGDFSSSTTSATEVVYTVSSATAVTHTLPSTITASGTYEFVRNDCASGWGLYVLPANSLTLDGDTTQIFLPPCNTLKIISNGTNWISNLDSVRTAGKGGVLLPDIPGLGANPQAGLPLTAINTPFAVQFVLKVPVKVSKITTSVNTGVASCVFDVAIADQGLNIITHINGGAGAACTGAANTAQTPSTVLTLAPGTYYLAQCSSTITTVLWNTFVLSQSVYDYTQPAQSGSIGTTANACTAGVFTNSALGAITNSSGPSALPTAFIGP